MATGREECSSQTVEGTEGGLSHGQDAGWKSAQHVHSAQLVYHTNFYFFKLLLFFNLKKQISHEKKNLIKKKISYI